MDYTIESVKDFQLKHIFECGQCFRWMAEEDGSYFGLAGTHIAKLRYIENSNSRGKRDSNFGAGTLRISDFSTAGSEEFWRNYLDLDRDYGKIKSKLAQGDPVMKRAVAYGSGIRILNQDLWEIIVSFLISQNNNIPRIKGCIERLACGFGNQIGEYEGRAVFSIPGPEEMARLTAEELGAVRLGYRAKYLVATARQVCEKGLPKTEEEVAALTGVGPKVASCISLFGLGNYDSFPIDVWMRRVMNRLYGIDEKDVAGMKDYAASHFGDLGGFAQQYLFYYMRENDAQA